MKTFTIPGYDKEDPTQAAPSVWILLFNAISNYPAGTVEQTKNGAEIMDALDAISDQDYQEDGKTPKHKYLKFEGGRIDLQDAAFMLLAKAVETFRTRTDRAGNPAVTMSSYKTLVMLDDLMENAVEYKAGEVPPGLEPPSDGPAAAVGAAEESPEEE